VTNTVILGPEETLLSSACHIQGLNLFDRSLCTGKTDVTVKIRYATPATAATVEPIDQDRLHLAFHVPQRALSPGQSAVLYDGDRVLGGGMIQAI
jgi:tRNA-specific 2-thiouridylase